MYQFITPAFTSQLTLCFIDSINASDISISHVPSVCRLPSCSLLNAVERDRNRLLGKKSKRLTRYERDTEKMDKVSNRSLFPAVIYHFAFIVK